MYILVFSRYVHIDPCSPEFAMSVMYLAIAIEIFVVNALEEFLD